MSADDKPHAPMLVDERGHPFVTVIHEKKEVSGWPEKIDPKTRKPKQAGITIRAALSKVLKSTWPCDAHMVQYAVPAVEVDTKHGKRLASELRLNSGAETLIPGGYTVELAIFDIDGPVHHHKAAIKSARDDAASDKVAELEARTPHVAAEHEAWWKIEREKILRVSDDHGPVAYRTGGGYRLLGRPDHPMRIASVTDREAWARQYLVWGAYLRLTYGIEIDEACAYAECLFRLPFVRRDGKDEVPETLGDPEDAYWCFNAEMDEEAALTEAHRLWPNKFGVSKSNGHSNGKSAITFDATELLARWETFDGDEQQRRIDLYVQDLQNGLEPSTDDNSGRATRLVAARSGVIGFGIGDLELVMELMLEHWVPRCDQAWTRGDLTHKVEDAAKNSQQMELDFNLPENVARRIEQEHAAMFAGILPPQTSPPSIAPVLALPVPSPQPASRIDRLRAMLDPPKPKLNLDEARAKIANAIRNAGKV